jgi:hypothetical protein
VTHVCVCVHVFLQVRSADSDDALREVFQDPDFEILLLNTGYCQCGLEGFYTLHVQYSTTYTVLLLPVRLT